MLTARLPRCETQSCKTEVYDINQAHKRDLVTGVEHSPLVLSNTRGSKDRFSYPPPDTRQHIDTNKAHKKDMVDLIPGARPAAPATPAACAAALALGR